MDETNRTKARRGGPDWLACLDRRSPAAEDRAGLAHAALQAALYYSGAPRGNVQFVAPDGSLRIEAQQGFTEEFLEYFRSVNEGETACAAARCTGAPVVVEDIRLSPIFAGKPALAAMEAAGALAVASFPILNRPGEVVGVVSVHYERPHRPTRHELAMMESVTERVGRLL